MKTRALFPGNIILISLGCFLLTINPSSGMFGEEYKEKEDAEAASLQAVRNRNLTAPDNQYSDLQVNGSSASARGDLNSSNEPREKTLEEIAKEQAIRNAIKSYFGFISQEQEDALVDEVNSNLSAQSVSVAKNTNEEGILIAFKLNSKGKLQGRFVSPEEAAVQGSIAGSAIPARSVSSDPRISKLTLGSGEVVVRIASPLRLRGGGGGASTMSHDEPIPTYRDPEPHERGYGAPVDYSEPLARDYDDYNQYCTAHLAWEAKKREEASK